MIFTPFIYYFILAGQDPWYVWVFYFPFRSPWILIHDFENYANRMVRTSFPLLERICKPGNLRTVQRKVSSSWVEFDLPGMEPCERIAMQWVDAKTNKNVNVSNGRTCVLKDISGQRRGCHRVDNEVACFPINMIKAHLSTSSMYIIHTFVNNFLVNTPKIIAMARYPWGFLNTSYTLISLIRTCVNILNQS